MIKIGNRIKSRRLALGMTQDELARRIGFKSRSSVNKIELGKQNITQSAIVSVARALDVPPGYIMGDGEEEPAAPKSDGLRERVANLDPDLQQQLADFVALAQEHPEAAKRHIAFAVGELQSLTQAH